MHVDTLSQLFLHTVKTFQKPDLLMFKKEGKYVPIATSEFALIVQKISMGLKHLGLKAGDKLILLSENRPDWVMTDFATLCLGAVTVPVYTSLTAEQIKYIINDSDAKFVVCSSLDLLRKVDAIRPELPMVRNYILFDGGGPDWTISLERLKKIGEEPDSNDRTEFEQTALGVKPDDLASIVYTSGTTGSPKGVMLSHANFVSNIKALDAVVEFTHKDTILSFLPLSHVLERMTTFSFLYKGATIAFAESVEKVVDNLMEIKPTIMISVPRLFDKFYARVMDNILLQSALRRKIFFWALKVGKKFSQKKLRREKISLWLKTGKKMADKLVLSKIVARVGGRVRFFVSGGAPLSRDVAEFFYAAGITILEGYGLTETAPVLTFNNFDRIKLGTVGVPVPGVTIKIAPDGEILAKGPNVMKGYYKKESETKEALEGGWFHTGDIGYFDEDGFLIITDRKKDIIVTSGGKNVAPQFIENLIKQSPYIQNVVIVGASRKFISALIVPDLTKLEAVARELGLTVSSQQEMIKNPEIIKFMLDEINRYTPNLASYEKVKKIALLEHDFDIDEELTPTLKIKRSVIERHYKDLIDTLYQDQATPDIRA